MAWDLGDAKEAAGLAGAALCGFLLRAFRRRSRPRPSGEPFTAEQRLELNKMQHQVDTAVADIGRLTKAHDRLEEQAREDLEKIRETVNAALARLWSFRRGNGGGA